MRLITFSIFLLAFTCDILGQNADSAAAKPKGFVFADAAFQMSALDNKISDLLGGSAISVGYQINRFSICAQFDQGKLSPRNFSSNDFVYQTQFSTAHAKLRFDVISKTNFKLFALAGYGSMNSKTSGDLKNSEGVNYHIWKDGTVRNLPENAANLSQAVVVQPDGIRETMLSELKTNVISLGIGAQFQIHNQWAVVIQHQYLIFDKQDFTAMGFKDYTRMSQLSVGVRYQFQTNQNKSSKPTLFSNVDYSSVDYQALENGDDDGDGVINQLDQCPFTPSGYKVNSLGCPPDIDGDGVYDQFDDELNTLPGAWVDAKGVTISDEVLKKKALDSTSVTVNVLRKVNKNSRPYPLYTNETYQNQVKIAAQKLPMAYQVFDGNRDGKLSDEEMKKAINDFFDKKTSTPAWLIYQAIEYRFRQQ